MACGGDRSGPKSRAVAVLACAAIVLFNVLFKSIVLKSAVLVGTGGTHIDFDFGRILTFLSNGVLSIIGDNDGPDYLIGESFGDVSTPAKWVWLILFAGPVLGGNCIALWRVWKSRSGSWERYSGFYEPISLALLFALVLGPTLTTIRLEQRWLFAPFIVLLLIFVGRPPRLEIQASRIPAVAMGLAVAFASIALDTLISNGFERVFFVSAGRYATKVKHDVVDRGLATGDRIAFITNPDDCTWTLINGRFFSLYGGKAKSVVCVSTLSDVVREDLGYDGVFGERAPGDRLENMTSKVREQIWSPKRRVAFDFLERFNDGKIDNQTPVDFANQARCALAALELGRWSTAHAHGDLWLRGSLRWYPYRGRRVADVRRGNGIFRALSRARRCSN